MAIISPLFFIEIQIMEQKLSDDMQIAEQALLIAMERIVDGNGAEAILCIANSLSSFQASPDSNVSKDKVLSILPDNLHNHFETHYQNKHRVVSPVVLFEMLNVSKSKNLSSIFKGKDARHFESMYLSSIDGSTKSVLRAYNLMSDKSKSNFSKGFEISLNRSK
jgi:hypothetical protein